MSMTVEITVNGQPIRRVLIDNLTERPTGVNTYRWTYARTDVPASEGLFSTQQGRLDHVMEDGAMELIAKVAQAASETEVTA
ncbi:hypothetical protein MHPYR_180107 [uncultured Mycobacterium sp.]|uniref:Uncharacterized protein n=1 Tax=uncultured Mycobacterium sp. TaxID=171292 RepID=A0A1Y5PD95_9MYCO|nr:hypothetical protein MHPYR_180107 [uncultured Mycobacterium sp.]